MKEKIAIALDTGNTAHALHLVKDLHDLVGMFKVGSELFMAGGPATVREIIDRGGKVFLDLKFHDIPNTVTQAVLESAKLGVSMLTIHAGGGRPMMESVAKALTDKFGSGKPAVVAVTVLTSLDTRALFEIGIEQALDDHVRRLALLAQDCGIDGVVCSARELPILRKNVAASFKIVVPGIRMPEQSLDDQHRTATPHDALAAGADYIVVGRAVTNDKNPRASLMKLLQEA